jgi:hypothetical protein
MESLGRAEHRLYGNVHGTRDTPSLGAQSSRNSGTALADHLLDNYRYQRFQCGRYFSSGHSGCRRQLRVLGTLIQIVERTICAVASAP